jgi:hypothetical protein
VANAERVVSGMKAGFLGCYNRALAFDPTIDGAMGIDIEVGTRGEVIEARPMARNGIGRSLDDELVQCLVRRVQAATFLPPEPSGTRARLTTTVTLFQDEP